MTPAFEVRDLANNIVLTLEDRAARLLGIINVNYGSNPNGQFADAKLAEGVPWVIAVGPSFYAPSVSADTQRVSWSANMSGYGGSPSALSFVLYYGTY